MRVLKTEDCFYVGAGNASDTNSGNFGDVGNMGESAGVSESDRAGAAATVAAWSGKDFMCSAAALSAGLVVGALATPAVGALASFATQQLCNLSTSGTALAGYGGDGGGTYACAGHQIGDTSSN